MASHVLQAIKIRALPPGIPVRGRGKHLRLGQIWNVIYRSTSCVDAVVFLDERASAELGRSSLCLSIRFLLGRVKNIGRTRLLTLYSSNASFHESIRAESSQISSCLISPVSVPIFGNVLERCCEEIVVYGVRESKNLVPVQYLSLPINPLATGKSATFFFGLGHLRAL